MFERFTPDARSAVVLAQESAREMSHNYIGTEHLLLGLLRIDSPAAGVLAENGVTQSVVEQRVIEAVGVGKKEPKGHIPFTPSAKKVLEFSLREALSLGYATINSGHVLLGLMRSEGKGVDILRLLHPDFEGLKSQVVLAMPADEHPSTRVRRVLGRFTGRGGAAEAGTDAEPEPATPAAEQLLSQARALAGDRPLASQHLLQALLLQQGSAAAQALAAAGVDADGLLAAARDVDVAGTGDDPLEEAGRRGMTLAVEDDTLVVRATDLVLVESARRVLATLDAEAGGVLRGSAPAAAPLADAWQALHQALETIAAA